MFSPAALLTINFETAELSPRLRNDQNNNHRFVDLLLRQYFWP